MAPSSTLLAAALRVNVESWSGSSRMPATLRSSPQISGRHPMSMVMQKRVMSSFGSAVPPHLHSSSSLHSRTRSTDKMTGVDPREGSATPGSNDEAVLTKE